MGARQSKRSVDITTTPKKEGVAAEGGVVGDAAAPGDGKLERIEETDTKPTTNGIAPHTDVPEDKEKDKDDATEKEKDKEKAEEVKAEETKQESAGESPAETAEVTTPTETNPTSPNTATSPDSKEVKKKDKVKKKWSFRSISFSKKDKSKPSREEAPKNGDITKEEPLAEGGEEAETGSATAGSPAEEKSAVSSPSAEEEAAPMTATEATPSTEAKEELAASAASSPAEEKKEEPTPSAPTPVPVEEKKEEVEKVEPEKKVVEVSPAGGQSIADPVQVSVFRVQPVATPSIIERKTSEDIPSLPPSSPPPTPIDPSPLQQAQQAQHAAATATALAEALKLPAQAADKECTLSETTILSSSANTATVVSSSSSSSCAQESNDPPKHLATEPLEQSPKPSSSSIEPLAEAIIPVHAKVEALPVVDKVAVSPPVSENFESCKSNDRVIEAPAVVVDAVAKSLAAVVTKVERKDGEKTSSEVIECKVKGIEDRELSNAQVTQIVESETRVSDGISQIKDDQRVEMSSDSVPVEEVMEIVEKQPEDLINPETIIPVCSVETKTKETVAEVGRIEVDSVAPVEESKEKEIVMERTEKLIEEVIESPMELEKEETEETRSTKDEMVTEPPESTSEFVLDSEEGPVPVSEEILVEAKPAVVIPEDDVEEAADTDADVSKVDTESVDVIPVPEEDRMENETESEIVTALATEEILMLEESSVPDDITIETSLLINETTTTTERVEDERKETETSVETLPPPMADLLAQDTSASESLAQESCALKSIVNESSSLKPIVHESPALEAIVHDSPALEPVVHESPIMEPVVLESSASNPVIEELSTQKSSSESSVPEVPVTSPPEDSELTNVQAEPNVISPPVVKAEPTPLEVCKIREEDPLPPRTEEHPMESSPSDVPIQLESSPRKDTSPCTITKKEISLSNESETRIPTSMPENPSHLENVPSTTQPDIPIVDLLPPEELSCPIRSNVSEITSELPVPVESAPSLRNPTETLLTPPRSPSPQSNVSIASGLTTSTTKDCSQTQLYDDQSNREFKMESVSISLNSYNESDIELKERLAESPAETVNQDESISCQLSNNAASSAAQEIHQVTNMQHNLLA